MSRFSPELIRELQQILKDQCGREYTAEDLQRIGTSVIRFIIAKREQAIKVSRTKRNVYGKPSSEKVLSK